MKTPIAIFSLAILQLAFFAVTYYQNPTDGFAIYYFSWMLVPATVAALTFAPHYHFFAAISNAIIAALLFDYLFIQHGYFWPERPKESPVLAIGYFVFGVGLAFVMAGFVHVVIKRIDKEPSTTKSSRTMIAMRKGLAFSTICAAIAYPLFTMFGPVGTGIKPDPPFLLALFAALGMILTGTIIAMVVGLTYHPTVSDATIAG
jgi:K+-sensing histidine kinase KdpD